MVSTYFSSLVVSPDGGYTFTCLKKFSVDNAITYFTHSNLGEYALLTESGDIWFGQSGLYEIWQLRELTRDPLATVSTIFFSDDLSLKEMTAALNTETGLVEMAVTTPGHHQALKQMLGEDEVDKSVIITPKVRSL